MTIRASVAAGVVAAGLAVVSCAAQQPKVTNAQVSVRSGALQQEIAAVKTATWIGYSIPVRHEFHNNWDDSVVYLEGGEHHQAKPEPKAGEAAPRANVLLRVTGGNVEKVQLEDGERAIDGGGLPFVWLTDVRPADSVRTLAALVDAGTTVDVHGRAKVDSVLVAIAVEDTPEAMPALREFTAAKYAEPVREKSAFWLANEGGREGLDAVTALLKSEKDDAFREKLVFDLTLVRGDAKKAATDELLTLAKDEPSSRVRAKAQFWLAQMAGRKLDGDPRIAGMLSATAKNDPEAAMRKSAVFALSRLPEDQAVPQLIQVASTTKDLSTRREAIFWLGQKKDPRALAYLEKVVKE
jgi:hypothetical protein